MIDKYIGKVINADCMDIMRELPDNCIDLILTDIPYNISQDGNGLRKLNYGEWDKQEGMEIKWITEMTRICKGSMIVFCGKKQFSFLLNYAESKDYITRTIVWEKPNPTVLNCDKLYIEGTELALFAKNRGALFNPKYKKNVFRMTSPIKRKHPTQKPIDLFMHFIMDLTNEKDIVLDPFCGSGTTGAAAERLDRKFICIEKEKDYCEIARERIKKEQSQLRLF